MKARLPFPAFLALIGIACAAPAARPSFGQVDRGPVSADTLVQTRLVADRDRIEPGRTFELAVVFDIKPQWHVYWEFSGDSGAPTDVTIKAPPGFTVGAPRFPRPRIFREPEGVTYGYTRRVAVFVPVTPPTHLETDEISLQASVFFLVCRERCLLGDESLTLRLPVGEAPADPPAATPAPASVDAATLEQVRRQLPAPIARLAGARARRDGDRLVIDGPMGGFETVQFLPIEVPGVRYGEAEVEIDAGRFRVSVPVRISPQNAQGKRMALRGVLGLGDTPDAPCYSFELSMKETP